jgi:predicted peptidase
MQNFGKNAVTQMPRIYFLALVIWNCSFFNLLLGSDLQIHQFPDELHQRTEMLNNDFVASVPPMETPDSKFPLLIFLHGAGGRGDDIERVERIARPVYKGMIALNREPAIFVAPQANLGTQQIQASWLPEDLDLFLSYLKKTLPVDEDRIYLTGNSMGGYGTWAWAAKSPGSFAAIAPVVGGLGKGGPKDISPKINDWAKQLVTTPAWVFHGANDKVVPVGRSQEMIRLIRENGGELARLTVFPDEGHGVGRIVYTSQEFFDWMFAKKSNTVEKIKIKRSR